MAKEKTKKREAVTKDFSVSFRCNEGLIKRLDIHAERLRAAQPGSSWTRSSGALNLVLKALDIAERGEES